MLGILHFEQITYATDHPAMLRRVGNDDALMALAKPKTAESFGMAGLAMKAALHYY